MVISEYLGIIYRIKIHLVEQHEKFGTSDALFPNTWELSTELNYLSEHRNIDEKRQKCVSTQPSHADDDDVSTSTTGDDDGGLAFIPIRTLFSQVP